MSVLSACFRCFHRKVSNRIDSKRRRSQKCFRRKRFQKRFHVNTENGYCSAGKRSTTWRMWMLQIVAKAMTRKTRWPEEGCHSRYLYYTSSILSFLKKKEKKKSILSFCVLVPRIKSVARSCTDLTEIQRLRRLKYKRTNLIYWLRGYARAL